MAQRVMDCGDADHILLSRRVADDLAQYHEWKPYLHDLRRVEVKHGLKLEVVNFYNQEAGNPQLPGKLKLAARRRSTRKVDGSCRSSLESGVEFCFLAHRSSRTLW